MLTDRVKLKEITYIFSCLSKNKARRKRQRKIIWFNTQCTLDVSTNVAKIFLNLIEKHFPGSSKLHKIFNKNTIKVSFSCTQNLSQIIKGHNKKMVQKETQETLDWNCRVKTDCPLNGDCRKKCVIYICTATTCDPKKHILDGLKENLKNRGIMTMSNLLKTNFIPTVLLFQVIYGE